MTKPTVRCRCGHQVLAKEVLRTDLFERSKGRDYVYVKFRCRRCKRLGETFIPESRWDWSILEAPHSEMNEEERDRFLDQNPISESEILDFHVLLEQADEIGLISHTKVPDAANPKDAGAVEGKPEAPRSRATERSLERPDEKTRNVNNVNGAGDARPEDSSAQGS